MKKTKIAICFEDKEYQERFLKCWIHHFKDWYEIHALTLGDDIPIKNAEYDIVLLEGEKTKELNLSGLELKHSKILYLTEETSFEDRAEKEIFKYQELYKIEQKIRTQFLEEHSVMLRENTHRKVIGVFSLDVESYQLPFCAMLASEYGESESCVLLDLQVSSGLEEAGGLAMDDIFVSLAAKTCTKMQIQDAIVSEKGWDYVSPIKNFECIAEVNKELCESLIEILEKEKGYNTYVINFGQMFKGCMEWMCTCNRFYMLVFQKERKSRREQAFIQALKRHRLEHLEQKMIRVEVSSMYNANESWRSLAERWHWNEIGDQIRLQIQEGG